MLRFGEFVELVTNVKKRYFAGYIWCVEFFGAFWNYVLMIVFINFFIRSAQLFIDASKKITRDFRKDNNFCGRLCGTKANNLRWLF